MAIRWERGCSKDRGGNLLVTETEFVNDVATGVVLRVKVNSAEPNRHAYAREKLKAQAIVLRQEQSLEETELAYELEALNLVDTRSFEDYINDVKPGFWARIWS